MTKNILFYFVKTSPDYPGVQVPCDECVDVMQRAMKPKASIYCCPENPDTSEREDQVKKPNCKEV